MTPAEVLTVARAMRHEALGCRHRRTLVLAGSADWGRTAARTIRDGLAWERWLWIGAEPGGVSSSAAHSHLGREVDLLVYDVRSGLDPDGFAAVSGTLAGGGLLVIPAWPMADWGSAPDPELARLAVYPFGPSDIGRRFLARFSRMLDQDPMVRVLGEEDHVPSLAKSGIAGQATGNRVQEECRTDDQSRAVEAIEKVVRGHRRRPLVMTADRGRGKSAALGIAVARLFRERRCQRVALTAPRRAAVDSVFEHAARLLPGSDMRPSRLDWEGCELRFFAPDVLTGSGASEHPADLLLVDEAAAMPASLLERLVNSHSRMVFSTTVHGYEGSGRGFALRFGDRLSDLTPGWHGVHLDEPVRWAMGDPLEDLLFRLFMMDAEPRASVQIPDPDADSLTHERLNRDRLQQDEALLSQVFGLLVAAHYRTSPLDLRHLLDGPNLQVRVLRAGDFVVATALVAEEGGFESDLAADVWAGRRRPKGHLLPQAMALHCGLREAAEARALRVIRIAVHPDFRRRGFGTRLIRELISGAEDGEWDLLGASFAASPGVATFWRHVGLQPLHFGSRPETSTGAHALLMASALSEAGSTLMDLASRGFAEDLPGRLVDDLSNLDVDTLLSAVGGRHARDGDLSSHDLALLDGFAHQMRSFESSRPVLARLGLQLLRRREISETLSDRQRLAFVARVLQVRPWAEVARLTGLSGRNAVIKELRQTTGRLLEALARLSD